MKSRPIIFVGSSVEGLSYAKALQQNLDHAMQVVLWSQGVFGLSNGTLEDLVEKLQTVGHNRVAVGMSVARHPPHRSVREELPHTAPASGFDA
jgi:predicted nucleotide-binding protein